MVSQGSNIWEILVCVCVHTCVSETEKQREKFKRNRGAEKQ